MSSTTITPIQTPTGRGLRSFPYSLTPPANTIKADFILLKKFQNVGGHKFRTAFD